MTTDSITRAYRANRREGMPARAALHVARAHERGWELYMASDEDTKHGDYARHWSVPIGDGMTVEVWQVSDSESCDCWAWAKDNPRDDGQEDDIPDHGHFGIVAETHVFGHEVAYDACWGYIWDWPGQDDEVELARAWDEVADHAIDSARASYASTPAWVREAMAIRGEAGR